MNSSPAMLLVVDDEQGMRDTLVDILEEYDFIVAQAADGQQAVHMVEAGAYDVVLMDVRMPVMDGVTALEAIVALPKHPPVVLMTAFTQTAELHRAAESAAAIVFKPLDLPALIQLLTKVSAQRAKGEYV